MPTTVDTINGVGGTGADFVSIEAWLSATQDLDLAAGAGTIRQGTLVDEVYEISGAAASLLLAQTGTGTRSAAGHRQLVSDGSAGNRYRPWANTGPRVYVNWANQTGDQTLLDIDEDWFLCVGIAFISDDVRQIPADASALKTLVRVQGSNVLFQSVTAIAEYGGARHDTLGPFWQCFHINGSSGDEAVNVQFYQCIAKGSRWQKGASVGFFFDAFSERSGDGVHGCWNCASYEFSRGTNPRGYSSLAASASVGPEIINCVGAGASGSDFGGLFSRWANIASQDSSAAASSFGTGSVNGTGGTGPDPASRHFVNPETMWTNAVARDLRLTLSSSLRDRGLDDTAILGNSRLSPGVEGLDMDANGRGTFWSIGPYETTGTRSTSPPTETIESIGDAGGRDHATIQAFMNSTEDRHLVDEDIVLIGEIHADSLIDTGIYDIGTTSLKARRTVCDATRYYELRAAVDSTSEFNRWQPHINIGIQIRSEGGTDIGDSAVLEVQDPYFRLSGVKLDNNYTGASAKQALRVRAPNVSITNIEATMASGTATSNKCLECQGDAASITNVICRGTGNGTTGATRGIQVRECEQVDVLHCIVDNIDGVSTSYGYHEGLRADRVRIANCIGSASGDEDFHHDTAADAGSTQSHNISTDATAAGPGSQVSATRTSLYVLSIGGDFRPLANAVSLNAGLNLFGLVTTDFRGFRRFNPPDVGAYEGVAGVVPLMGQRVVRNDLAELCSLWRITRTDGTAFYFTDSNEPIAFRGNSYVPTNSINASARTAQAGLAESSVSTEGAIDSSAITETDLRAGRFDQARVDWFLVDWRYPWGTPVVTRRYVMDRTQHTSEVWSAEFVGIANKLERRAGRLITVGCPYVVGDSECRVDLSANTVSAVAVDSVANNRLSFDADSTDLGAGFADDFFGAGEIFWETGNNAGLLSTVKTYTQATRSITLEIELPLIIQVGDTFRIKPGCRKRYVEDCITKFSNGRRYGGDPFIPPASEQLDAPRR